MGTGELRAIVRDRFPAEPRAGQLLDLAVSCGANLEGLRAVTEEFQDFDSWRYEIEDWIDWLRSDGLRSDGQ